MEPHPKELARQFLQCVNGYENAMTRISAWESDIFFPVKTKAGRIHITLHNLENRVDKQGSKIWVDAKEFLDILQNISLKLLQDILSDQGGPMDDKIENAVRGVLLRNAVQRIKVDRKKAVAIPHTQFAIPAARARINDLISLANQFWWNDVGVAVLDS